MIQSAMPWAIDHLTEVWRHKPTDREIGNWLAPTDLIHRYANGNLSADKMFERRLAIELLKTGELISKAMFESIVASRSPAAPPPEPAKLRFGYFYILRGTSSGHLKIGRTEDEDQSRPLSQMVASSELLDFLAFGRTDHRVHIQADSWMKSALAPLRADGKNEWYKLGHKPALLFLEKAVELHGGKIEWMEPKKSRG